MGRRRIMKYSIVKSTHMDFAHFVEGHTGPCINIHGHTWQFELEIEAEQLNQVGFVVDFSSLKRILVDVHALLDHSMAMSERFYDAVASELGVVGGAMLGTRRVEVSQVEPTLRLNGAKSFLSGMDRGIKLAVFPFSPTSERLAQWLFELAEHSLDHHENPSARIVRATVYETLHPVEAKATYCKSL